MTPQELANNPTTSYNQINADDTSNDVSEIGTSSDLTISEQPPKISTFDYLYEFSETRKVLEEFFKCPGNDEKVPENGSDVDSIVRFDDKTLEINTEIFIYYFRTYTTSLKAIRKMTLQNTLDNV